MPKVKEMYTADSIQIDLNLDVVRKSPQVYIGTPDSSGVFLLLREVIDNSKDEAIAGFGKHITIIYEGNETFWVIDEGRGIPVDTHKVTKVSALETVLGHLSAGGKNLDSGKSAYNKSGGIHGMGVSITNALSEKLQAWSYRDKKWHTITYKKGKPQGSIATTKLPKIPYDVKPKNQGTIINFKIDLSVFMAGSAFDVDTLKDYLQLNAYLYPGLSFTFINKGKSKTYHEPKGLQTFVDAIITEKEVEKVGKPFIFNNEDMDIIMQWSSFEDNMLVSFVNGINTADGGTHIQGLYKALGESLKKLKKKTDEFRVDDIQFGIIGVMNFKIDRPRFSDQTKRKLDTKEANDTVYKALLDKFNLFFSKNKSLARSIIKRAVDIRSATEKFKMSKKAAASLKVERAGKTFLPADLKDCDDRDIRNNELFIVEGKSAEGGVTSARDKRFQAILAVQGKVLNVYRDKKNKIWESKPILNILQSIGYDSSLKEPMSRLRYGKIILFTDPDPDGAHISLLLASLLNKVAPELFERGIIFEPVTSLYTYAVGSSRLYGKDMNQLRKRLAKQYPTTKFNTDKVTRIKGLGEVGPDVLTPMAFDKTTRKLIRIEPLKSTKEIKQFIDIISEKSTARQELLGVGEGADTGEE